MIAQRALVARVTLDANDIASKGEGVSFAVRNAFDYFATKETQNVSQRVLNLYYGSLAGYRGRDEAWPLSHDADSHGRVTRQPCRLCNAMGQASVMARLGRMSSGRMRPVLGWNVHV